MKNKYVHSHIYKKFGVLIEYKLIMSECSYDILNIYARKIRV